MASNGYGWNRIYTRLTAGQYPDQANAATKTANFIFTPAMVSNIRSNMNSIDFIGAMTHTKYNDYFLHMSPYHSIMPSG